MTEKNVIATVVNKVLVEDERIQAVVPDIKMNRNIPLALRAMNNMSKGANRAHAAQKARMSGASNAEVGMAVHRADGKAPMDNKEKGKVSLVFTEYDKELGRVVFLNSKDNDLWRWGDAASSTYQSVPTVTQQIVLSGKLLLVLAENAEARRAELLSADSKDLKKRIRENKYGWAVEMLKAPQHWMEVKKGVDGLELNGKKVKVELLMKHLDLFVKGGFKSAGEVAENIGQKYDAGFFGKLQMSTHILKLKSKQNSEEIYNLLRKGVEANETVATQYKQQG